MIDQFFDKSIYIILSVGQVIVIIPYQATPLISVPPVLVQYI